MTTSHTERASRMGYGGPVASKPRAPAAPIETLYGNPYETALGNYYDPREREARLSGVSERVERVRTERQNVEGVARRKAMKPGDLQTTLAVIGEYEDRPRDDEAKKQIKAMTSERIIRDCGSEALAQAHGRSVTNMINALEKEVPDLIARAKSTGASSDHRLFNALVPYGENAI